jgi:hypothetical protein
VVRRAWDRGFTVSSDFARQAAPLVAQAASAGFITTRIATNEWGTTWRVTPEGLAYLWREIA